METYDVAVVGAGLAGLVAANHLADSGKSVLLLEKSTTVGGRAKTNRKGPALFNLGGHALYRGGEAESVLGRLGVRIKGNAPPSKYSCVWQNRVVPLPYNPVQLLTSTLGSWSSKVELARLMISIGKVDAQALMNTSLRDYAEHAIRHPIVRHIFYSLCRTSTYTSDPDGQIAGLVLKQVQRTLKSGVLYLDGGWQTIVRQLYDRIVQSGIMVLENCKVTSIQVEDGRVRGIRISNGECIKVGSVISTCPPAETYGLVHGATLSSLERWQNETRPAYTACLDLCLKRLPVSGRNVALGIDVPIFFSNHSASARLSDDGTSVVHLIKYNGIEKSDAREDRRLLEATMSLLHPDWKKELVEEQFLPNMMAASGYPRIGQSEKFPGPKVSEVRGLYVAGDWVSHGEMLADAAVASAERAAGCVVRDHLEKSTISIVSSGLPL